MNPVRLLVCHRFCRHAADHGKADERCAGFVFFSHGRRIDFLEDSISRLDPAGEPLFALRPEDPRLEEFRRSCPRGCGSCAPEGESGVFEPCGGMRVLAGLLSADTAH